MVVKEYETLIGKIVIGETDGYITNIYFENDKLPNNTEVKETDLIKEAIRQINLYLSGNLRNINVPIKINGTKFQQLVWNQLSKIEYGQTCTYKDIAIAIGNPNACRAVGNANNKNKLPLIIPCHRVIGTSGKLVGFAGGLDIKQKLLYIEEITMD
jgi:methylated-DNA-[protein]-cysteine S-methyltransferase